MTATICTAASSERTDVGTVYSMGRDRCECCGRVGEKWMICKSMHTFRGYLQAWEAPDERPIASWRDWRALLLDRAGTDIEDEYGTVISVGTFINLVEAVPQEDRRRQYEAVLSTAYAVQERYWLDADGFTFYNGEFS